MKIRIYFLYMVILSLSASLNADTTSHKPIYLAIPDFKAPTNALWLGAAVAESISVKLTDVRGIALLERRRIQDIIRAKRNEELTPSLLGCDYVLLGSIQLMGNWEEVDAKIRISGKIITSESGAISGDGTFVLDSMLRNLFAMESNISKLLSDKIGFPITALQSDYREEQNHKAKMIFGKALCQLEQAESAEDAVALQRCFQETIRLFREAQQENVGVFFARAHYYEGYARECLAKRQTDHGVAGALREATIKQFQKDAEQAAPAFFDLGRAYEENEKYEQAIGAYDDFLKWIGKKSRVRNWRFEAGHAWQDVNVSYSWQTNLYENAWHRLWSYFKGTVFVHKWNNDILALDALTGKTLWETHLPGAEQVNMTFCILYSSDKLFALVDATIVSVNIKTGSILSTKQLNLSPTINGKQYCRTSFAFITGRENVLLLRRTNWKSPAIEELVALCPDSLEILWQNSKERKRSDTYSRQWVLNDSILRKINETVMAYDAETYRECSERFSSELLHLLPFNGDTHGDIYFDENVFAYLVRYSSKNGKLLDCWQIDAWNEPPTKIQTIDAVIERHHMDGFILNAFAKEENLQERLNVLGFDFDTMCARMITLPKRAFEKLKHPEEWQWYPRIFLQGEKLIVFENQSTVSIYRADESFSLLWRYQSSSLLWGAPILDREQILIYNRDENANEFYMDSLKPPACRLPISELDARYRKGICLERMMKDEKALSEYNSILNADATYADAIYQSVLTDFRYGFKQEGWGRAEYFYRCSHPSDPRRIDIWNRIISDCGVLLRVPYVWWKCVAMLPEDNRFLAAYPKGLNVYNLADPQKSWSDTSLESSKCNVLVGVGKEWATVFRPCPDKSKSEFVQYDLITRKKTIQSYPPLKAVHINYWHTHQELRNIYSQRPALYQNRIDSSHFVLIHPKTMKIEGSFVLSAPIKMKNVERFMHSSEDVSMYDCHMSCRKAFEICSVCATYDNHVVLFGVPNEKNVKTFLLAIYSLEKKRLVLEKRILMDKDTLRTWNALFYGVRMYCIPLGNQLLVRGITYNNWVAISMKTGEVKDTQIPWDALNAFYGNDIGIAKQCLDETFEMSSDILKKWKGGGLKTCLPIWADGPIPAYNEIGTKQMTFYLAGKPQSREEALEQKYIPWGEGLLNAPPYTVFCIDEPDKAYLHDERKESFLYVCKNDVLYKNTRAWKSGPLLSPPSQSSLNEIPLHHMRNDTTKRFDIKSNN